MPDRGLHLGYLYRAAGSHPAGWRFPGAKVWPADDVNYLADVARRVEDAAFDFLFLADRLAASTEVQYTNPSVLTGPEPFTSAAYLATRTSRLGLVVTANTTYYEPFNLARLVASLDHISAGRAAWNLVADGDPRAAANYSRQQHGDPGERYDRADEFVYLVSQLWDSWEDGAFVRNKATGEFVDGAKIHAVDHVGAFFQVRGPLNLSRPPQGHPVILHDATGERSRQLAARHADVVVAATATVEDGLGLTAELRGRASALGRDPAGLLVLPSLTPVVAETAAAARAIHDQLNGLIVLDEDVRFGGASAAAYPLGARMVRGEEQGPGRRNLGALSQRLGIDVTGERLDTPVAESVVRAVTDEGRRLVAAAASRSGRLAGASLTWRDVLYAHIWDAHVVVGGPGEVADYMERWLAAGACDGFTLQSAFLPDQLDQFIRLVVPELRSRGLFRTSYAGSTLRDHLGLPRPASTLAGSPAGSRETAAGAPPRVAEAART